MLIVCEAYANHKISKKSSQTKPEEKSSQYQICQPHQGIAEGNQEISCSEKNQRSKRALGEILQSVRQGSQGKCDQEEYVIKKEIKDHNLGKQVYKIAISS